MGDFKLPAILHEYPLSDSEKLAFYIEGDQDPVAWVEDNIRLPSYYAKPGKVILHEWQKQVLRMLVSPQYRQINIVGSTQVGKSFICELAIIYLMRFLKTSILLTYSTQEITKAVVEQRLRPIIEINPELSQFIKSTDDMTVNELKMKSNIILRTASACSKNSIASFSSKIVYGSEVSKYTANYDVIKYLKGRYQAHIDSGDYKLILESSPQFKHDKYWHEVYKKGTTQLYPHVPCPHCSAWFYMEDKHIKERCNSDGVHDHDFNRVRNDKAAYLECPECHGVIEESHHISMLNKVVFAADPGDISPDGKLLAEYTSPGVSIFFNRLVNFAYTFSDALGNFFEARQSVNIESLFAYQQEDCARFVDKTSSHHGSSDYLLVKCAGYVKDGAVPDEVLCATIGIDTQDHCYYYTVIGYGKSMSVYILDEGRIDVSIEQDEKFKGYDEVYKAVHKAIFSRKIVTTSGRQVKILYGLIDRGGHKAAEVDYLCSKIAVLQPYVGSTMRDSTVIKKSATGNFYLGNKELLSKKVEMYSESDMFYLPSDISDAFLKQFRSQYWQDFMQRNGSKKTVFIHGGEDHLRDCCNYAIGASVILRLDKRLFDERSVAHLKGVTVDNPALAGIDKPRNNFICNRPNNFLNNRPNNFLRRR